MNRTKRLLCAWTLLMPATAFAQQSDTSAMGPLRAERFQATSPMQVDTPVRAIEYSDAYGTRVTIHRIGSYAILPLFAAEFALGQRLINDDNEPGWMRSAHGAVAGGIGVVMGVNTVTGVWNLIESRKDPEGRTRRLIHSALMLASNAGFVYTASLAEDDDEGEGGDDAREHRNAAVVSIGLSTASTLLMWLWKD